jgi:hypothetical protein
MTDYTGHEGFVYPHQEVVCRDQSDKMIDDAYEFHRTTHSKFTRDLTKSGVRNFAHGCLDDYLSYHVKPFTSDTGEYKIVITGTEVLVQFIAYEDGTDFTTNELRIGTIKYDEDGFKVSGQTPGCTDRDIELLEDLTRLVYKYEIGTVK